MGDFIAPASQANNWIFAIEYLFSAIEKEDSLNVVDLRDTSEHAFKRKFLLFPAGSRKGAAIGALQHCLKKQKGPPLCGNS